MRTIVPSKPRRVTASQETRYHSGMPARPDGDIAPRSWTGEVPALGEKQVYRTGDGGPAGNTLRIDLNPVRSFRNM
jgi:hypothetical protein